MLFASHFWAMPEAGVFVKSYLSLLSKVPEGGVGLAETVQMWLGGAGSVEQIWVVELGETVEEMTHDYKSHPLDPSKSLEYHRILTNSVQPTKQSHLIRLHMPLAALASLCMWAVLKPSTHEKLRPALQGRKNEFVSKIQKHGRTTGWAELIELPNEFSQKVSADTVSSAKAQTFQNEF